MKTKSIKLNVFDWKEIPICETCDKEIKVTRKWIRFCSRKCHDKYHNRQKALRKQKNSVKLV